MLAVDVRRHHVTVAKAESILRFAYDDPVSTTPSGEKPLRKDAARNHAALLEAAKAAFAADGIDVPVEEIARRAGVGVGTVYRHFPTKDDLVHAIVEQRLTEFDRCAGEALGTADPVRSFFEQAVAIQARDRAFKEVVSARLRTHAVSPARKRLLRTLRLLVRHAQAAGTTRDDVTAQDLVLLLVATGRLVEVTEEGTPGLWRRYVGLLLDGLAPAAARRLPRRSMSGAELERLAGGPPRDR